MRNILIVIIVLALTGVAFADLTATEGLAIDLTSGGAGTTLTVALDPTELLGNRTWGDASTDSIVWTWNRATGTDPTLTFGNGMFTFGQDITISGDDLFMATNTDTYLLVADGTNYNPVAMSGDIAITNAGVTALQTDTVAVAEFLASQDWGDMSTAADGTVSLDNDVVAVAEFLASQDWGEVSTAADGTVSLDADVVAAAEMADADHGDISWTSGVAAVEDLTVSGETAGDVLYFNGSNWIRLAKGSAGQVLEMNAGATAPEWDTDDSGTPGADSITTAELDDASDTPAQYEILTIPATTTQIEYLTIDELLDFTIGSNGFLQRTGAATYGIDTIDEDDCTNASDLVRSAIQFVIDGGGSAISAGGGTPAGYIEIPFGCTIVRGSLLADQVGSIVIDVWVDDATAFDGGTLVDADSIMDAGTPLTIANENYATDSTMTSWTTSLVAAEIMAIHVDSCATIERCTISLIVEK